MKKLIELAAAVAGGVAATYLMKKGQRYSMTHERWKLPEMKEDPGHYLVSLGEGLLGRRLDKRKHGLAMQGLSFTYGTMWPLGLSLLASRIGKRSAGRVLGAGALMGAVVYAMGYAGWLPLAGLTKPPHKHPLGVTANAVLGHMAYGAFSALPIALAEKYIEA